MSQQPELTFVDMHRLVNSALGKFAKQRVPPPVVSEMDGKFRRDTPYLWKNLVNRRFFLGLREDFLQASALYVQAYHTQQQQEFMNAPPHHHPSSSSANDSSTFLGSHSLTPTCNNDNNHSNVNLSVSQTQQCHTPMSDEDIFNSANHHNHDDDLLPEQSSPNPCAAPDQLVPSSPESTDLPPSNNDFINNQNKNNSDIIFSSQSEDALPRRSPSPKKKKTATKKTGPHGKEHRSSYPSLSVPRLPMAPAPIRPRYVFSSVDAVVVDNSLSLKRKNDEPSLSRCKKALLCSTSSDDSDLASLESDDAQDAARCPTTILVVE